MACVSLTQPVRRRRVAPRAITDTATGRREKEMARAKLPFSHIKQRSEANMEKMAPEGSKERAMVLTGGTASVVGGGVAGAVLAGPAAPIGFVAGALVGGLVLAGVLVSDGLLDEQADEADNEQPAKSASLEDALLGKFRGGPAGDRPDGGNGSSKSSRPNTHTDDLFSRLRGRGPNP